MGCVYFIKHNGVDPIKIGFTKDDTPFERLKAFNTYSPFGCKLIGYFNCDNFKEVEAEIHSKNKHLRRNGEFFDISVDTAINMIESFKTRNYTHELVIGKETVFYGSYKDCVENLTDGFKYDLVMDCYYNGSVCAYIDRK